MRVELELQRLEQIQHVLGTGVPEIVADMLRTMSRAVEQVENALAGEEDLPAAAKAAHAARNDALLVGARDLLAALTEVEQGCRADDAAAARRALARLRQVWPSTRDALNHVATEAD